MKQTDKLVISKTESTVEGEWQHTDREQGVCDGGADV
jgi:hypothetical protein